MGGGGGFFGSIFSSILGSKPAAPAPAPAPAPVAAPAAADVNAKAQASVDKRRKASLLSQTDLTKGTADVGGANVGQKQLLGQ